MCNYFCIYLMLFSTNKRTMGLFQRPPNRAVRICLRSELAKKGCYYDGVCVSERRRCDT